MKKILLLMVVTFIVGKSFGQISSKMSITDKKGRIVIYDSSAIDTNYAPIIIPKDGYTEIETNQMDQNGSILIFIRGHTNGYKSYIEINSKTFNDFNNNNILREWIDEALNEDYYREFTYDASNNLIKAEYSLVIGTDTTISYYDTLIYDNSNNLIKFWTVE